LANRHPSAIKRHRQSLKRQIRNRTILSQVKNKVRKLRETVDDGNPAAAEAQLRAAIKELNKAATKGVIHRNAASRRIARLSRRVDQIKSAG
jgi:small subunit ribosomal protein S20